MRLHKRTLESLADMICGHAIAVRATSSDQPQNNFRYRSSTYLTRFFEDCDLDYVHNGTTRKWWVMSVLEELNEQTSNPELPSPSLIRVLQELLDRENFVDDAQRDAALKDVNITLARDSVRAFFDDDAGRTRVQNTSSGQLELVDRLKRAPWTQAQLAYRKRLESYLDEASEDFFIETILVPLFVGLGFTRISVTGHEDKHLEFGKDLWMKFRLPTGHLIYFGCQAKREKLDASATGRNVNVATIFKQVEMMIGHPIFDPDDNRKHLLDHCFIISAGEITKAARHYLAERLDQQARRHIVFMDRSDLLDLCTRLNLHIPVKDDSPQRSSDSDLPF